MVRTEVHQDWRYVGETFRPDPARPWSQSFAQMPTAVLLDSNELLVLFASRDRQNQSRIGSVRYRLPGFRRLSESKHPVLDRGAIGTFDHAGVMPSSIIRINGLLYLYYVGWSRGVDVPYRNAIGLAVSRDSGESFERVFGGPVIDRTHAEPFFCGTSCVRRSGDRWVCWYMSCNGWERVNGSLEAHYDIKRAVSDDGVTWSRNGQPSLSQSSTDEAIARASVAECGGEFHMWFDTRSLQSFRKPGDRSHQIRHAISTAGVVWQREAGQVRIESAPDLGHCRAYPEVIEWEGRRLMLHNGERFGEAGFAIAERVA